MNKIKILLADSDLDYAKALGNILVNRYPIFYVEILDIKTFEYEGIKQHKESYDLILVDENWKNIDEDDSHIIGLCQENILQSNKDEYIYKYAGVNEISAVLQTIYARLSGNSSLKYSSLEAQIICFTSAAGGVGKTSIAIAIARELASYHNLQVLYLSMEKLESTSVYLAVDNGNGTLSDYLYYLYSQGDHHIATYTDAFIFKDEYGLEAFRPSKGINELTLFTQEKLSYFLESVCKFRNYHYICIDFDADTSPQSLYLLKRCKKIVLIDDGSSKSIYKNNKFMNFLNSYYHEDLESNIFYVRNKWNPSSDNLPSNEIFILENDIDSFNDIEGFIDMNINQGFGMGVKRLAKEIRRDS